MSEKVRLSLYLSPELAQKVKHTAIDRNQRVNELIVEAIEKHLAIYDELPKKYDHIDNGS